MNKSTKNRMSATETQVHENCNLNLVRIFAVIVIGIGLLVINGWIFDISILKSIAADQVTMKFSTAFSFLISGVILYLMSEIKQKNSEIAKLVLPAPVIAISFFMAILLISSLLGVNTGIENLFIKENHNAVNSVMPGVPSLVTMIEFILIAIAGTFSLRMEFNAKKQLFVFGSIIATIGSIAVIGYIGNIPFLYYMIPGWSTAMAIHTSIAFMILGAGIILLAKDKHKTTSMLHDNLGIRAKFVILILAIVVPPIALAQTYNYAYMENQLTTGVNQDSTVLSSLIISSIATVIILITVASVIFTKSITEPIRILRKAATEIADGNFDLEIQVYGKNELAALARDIEQMESKLAKSKIDLLKSERLSTIGEISARIAHDLRNPLSIIISTIELMELRNKDKMSYRDKEDMDRLHRATDKLNHQIKDVLDHVRIRPLDLKTVKISSILSNSISSLYVPNEVRIVKPQTDFDISCDPQKIEVVFSNLIKNAIQAMENKGEIKISTKENESDIEIEFVDDGPGIPDDSMKDIFEPLFTTKQSGTGLGLTSCKSIVTQHGGTISVRSNPTTFVVKLLKMPAKIPN